MATAVGSYATLADLKTRANLGTATTDDTLLGDICDQINGYIESPAATGRILAPISGTPAYTFDGDGGTVLWFPTGIRTVTTLEVALYTGATYATVGTADYFLRPHEQDRDNGWPALRIEFSDRPTGSYARFPVGYDTVRVTGTFGWAAIPDEITEIALVAAVRAWHARESGQTDIVGTDEFGKPLVSRFFSARDYATLKSYSAGGYRIR